MPGMSQRAGYSALFAQIKLFRNVSYDKPNEHGRISAAFWESVFYKKLKNFSCEYDRLNG